MKATAMLDVEQIFTSFNNPKGNAETERMMRTIKEECVWLHDFEAFEEAKSVLGHWIEVEYNTRLFHSAT